MKAFVVGGAVRDELLGLPVVDHDWVVVGATPEEMSAAGYRPVGRDFPVFLHPTTHEEYALARTERKSGRGYRGFTVYAAPDVTLDEDLARRDLTINAMARAPGGALVDPFGGEADLRAGVLRHVSDAFSEDPVRVLRVARFAARFGFRIAEETQALMRRLAASGEMDHLVAERVWQEFSRGLGEAAPWHMLDVLAECGALQHVMPELHGVLSAPGAPGAARAALEHAVRVKAGVPVRFALFAWRCEAACEATLEALCTRVRAPNEVSELALAACRCRAGLEGAGTADATELLSLLKRADAFRRPERLEALLEALRCAAPTAEAAAARSAKAFAAARTVEAGAIAARESGGERIAAAIDAARSAAIAQALAA